MMTNTNVMEAHAQAPEGAVRIVPPISSIDVSDGPFTVFVVLDDLQHFGTLSYDDNRDTVPDREVESIGLAAFEFDIGFDPALLRVEAIEPSPAGLERTGRDFQCLAPREDIGLASFGCVSTGPEPPGPQGTLTLASVVLRPLARGASALILDVELAGPLGADQVPVEVYGAAVRIGGKSIDPGSVVTPAAPVAVATDVTVATATVDLAAQPTSGAPLGTTPTPTELTASNVLDDGETRGVIEAESADGDASEAATRWLPWLLAGLGAGALVALVATAAMRLRRGN